MPRGDAGDFLDTGCNYRATLGLPPAMLPVGARLDALWHSCEGDDGHELSVLRGTANAVVAVRRASMRVVSPYLIGGLGLYSAEGGGGTDRENEFGWNVGGGFRFNLAGFSTFAEARYNSFSLGDSYISYVPITF